MKMAFQKNTFYPSVMLDHEYRQPRKGAESKIKGKESKTVINNKYSIGELYVNKMKGASKGLIKSPAILKDCKVKLTFQQLDEISTFLAKDLVNSINSTKGTMPNKDGDVVVAIVVNEWEELDERLVTCLFACTKAGLTFMILDTATTRTDDVEWALGLVRPVMLITGNQVKNIDPIIASMKKKVGTFASGRLEDIWQAVTLENAILRSVVDTRIPVLNIEDPESWLDQVHFDRTVGIYFTAGSEGLPHGVRVSSREIFNRIHWQNKVFPVESTDEFALTSALTDPRSLAQIFVPILAGKSVTLIPHATMYDVTELLKTISIGRLTRITITPPLYMTLFEEATNNPASKEQLNSLTHVIVTGDALTESMARKFFTVFPTALASGKVLIATYGTTELLGEATYEIFQTVDDLVLKALELDPEILSVGVPISNTTVIIVDQNEVSVPVGCQGEIMFSGAVVSSALRGYVGQGSGIAAQLNMNDRMLMRGAKKRIFYKTGDYGRIIPGLGGANRLYIEGRTETEKNVEGRHINFEEIDECVRSTQLVKDAVTLVYYRGRESQVVITACVLKEGTTLLKVSKAVRNIPPRKIVHYPVLFAVQRIPYLMNGRINKRELRTIFRKYVTSCEESEWGELDLRTVSQDLTTVKLFCTAVGQSIGMSVEEVIAKFDRSYWDIGGTPVNAVMTMAFCTENGFTISVEDFAASAADSLSHVCERMLPIEAGTLPEPIFPLAKNPNGRFEYKGMTLADKNDVSLFIAELTNATDTLQIRKYYTNIIEKAVTNFKTSVIAKSLATGRTVGAAINIPEHPKLPLGKPPVGIKYGLELINKCNDDARYKLWRRSNGKIMHVTFLGIDHYAYLQPSEVLLVTRDLLLQSSISAVSSGYSTVIVTTSNPLIQEVAVKLLGFESILDRQLCKFKAKDGVRPFAMADDNHLISVLLKDLSKELKSITEDQISQADLSLVSINTQPSVAPKSHSLLSASALSNTVSSPIA